MATCSHCNGSRTETWEEDGLTVSGCCYHCAGTGQVDDQLDHQDQLRRVASALAYLSETEYRKKCDRDPEGESYAFMAAESMLSPEEFFNARVCESTSDYVDQLNRVDSVIQKALIEWYENSQRPSQAPTVRPPSPNGMEPDVMFEEIPGFTVGLKIEPGVVSKEFQDKLSILGVDVELSPRSRESLNEIFGDDDIPF